MPTPNSDVPFMHVVRGEPDDEEIAAVTIALLGLLRPGTGDMGDLACQPHQVRWVRGRDYQPPGSWKSR